MGKRLLLFFLLINLANLLHAQGCFNISTGRDTAIACNQSCITLKTTIPDIRSSDNYKVISTLYNPHPYYVRGGTTVTVSRDDVWSPVINLPFSFCFFGVNYNYIVVGANGIVSFDTSNAGKACSFMVPDPLPSTYYAKACIMGVYHDINPADPAGASPNRSLQYSVVGSAPCRKMVINFFKIPLYGSAGNNGGSNYCRQLLATHQIVLYEGTGVIDVNIEDKPVCPQWPLQNGGRAMVGIQNYDCTIGVTPLGRAATQWGSTGMNESWRFVPNSGVSKLNSLFLYRGNTYIATANTTPLGNGELAADFRNVCLASSKDTFRVVASYKRCDNPSSLTTAEDTIVVTRADTITPLATARAANCTTGNIGGVTITSPVGAAFEYSADGTNYQAAPSFGLPPGPYTIRVRNMQTSCFGSVVITVPVTQSVRYTAKIINASCYGTANGKIIITTQAGAPPFRYSSDGGVNYQPSDTLILAAGTYTLRVQDANGCTKDTTIVVSQPDRIRIASPQVKAASCSGLPDGQIILSASGGTLPYRFSLSDSAGAIYQRDSTLLARIGGFTAYVRDANSCVDSATNITVPLNDTMRLAPLPDTAVCIGSSITLRPRTNATWFQWSPDLYISDTAATRPTFSPQDTTTYYLKAGLGALCTRTDTFRILVWKQPVADAGQDTTICYGTQAYFQAKAIGSNRFRWSPAAGLSSPTASATRVRSNLSGLYTVEVTDTYGCNFRDYDTVQLTVLPQVQAYAGQDTTATLGQPVQLSGCCTVSYLWQPASIFESDTARQPIGHFPAGTTQVLMTAITAEGCEGKDTILVKGYAGPTYYVPNAFSPGNRDGRNDVFRPIPVGIRETYYFNVYNRMGQLVYTTKTFMQGWDGTLRGELLPEAAYVWVVKGISTEGKIVEQKGTVLLMN
jgi:gliding motility-associated-like protein